jgi:Domain of unknown function (DUF4338)
MTRINVAFREARLRRAVRAHLRSLGFTRGDDGELVPPSLDKETYRFLHLPQRIERLNHERDFIRRSIPELKHYFAAGPDVDPDRIRVRLEPIEHTTWQSDLFRLAALSWSVPVSMGFGRRLRFLVWDDHPRKLLGLLALADPVFNLGARDSYIGWTSEGRGDRLVHLLDGYVVGALPPYSQLLGTKLVACLIRTRDVMETFRERYRHSEGIISGKAKNAHLVAVTTTSALGRSSVYNRLRLQGMSYMTPIGFTGGYGHFHFPSSIFSEMRAYLTARGDPYAGNHRYGNGPNWRLRTIRRTLQLLGLDPHLLRHGLPREVFVSYLADNAREILRGERKRPNYDSLKSVAEVSELALSRWVRPRASRDQNFRLFTAEEFLTRLDLAHAKTSSRILRRAGGYRD